MGGQLRVSNDYSYSDEEKTINKILKIHSNDIDSLQKETSETQKLYEDSIKQAELTLHGLGIDTNISDKSSDITLSKKPQIINVRTWEEISREAQQLISCDVSIKDIFTEEELRSNEEYLIKLREEFNALHRLDAIDYTICGIAGVLAAAVDLLLVGIPEKTKGGIEAGPLSNYIRIKMEEALPPD